MDKNIEADYYIENGLYVFTETYHKRRGYCCGSECRHCPYNHQNVGRPEPVKNENLKKK